MSPNSSTSPTQVPQRLEACYRRGGELVTQHNLDYAHEMFVQCVTEDPGNLAYVEAMLNNLRARHGSQPKKSLRLRSPGASRALKNAATERDYSLVIRLGIEALAADPWHVATLHVLAETCAAQHFNEVELAYLKQALDGAPKDANVNRHCARSLARMGQFDQAIACWHRVEEIKGKDREAETMILRLSEERMKYPGGIPPAIAAGKGREANSEEQKIGEDSAGVSGGQEQTGACEIVLSPRQRIEGMIKNDPADVANYLELARLLCELGQFENAERTLMQAWKCCAQQQPVVNALQRIRELRAAAVKEAAEIERRKQIRAERGKLHMPWLEISLAAAGLALLFQFLPGWWTAVSTIVVEHLQILLFVANILGLLGLLALRRKAL